MLPKRWLTSIELLSALYLASFVVFLFAYGQHHAVVTFFTPFFEDSFQIVVVDDFFTGSYDWLVGLTHLAVPFLLVLFVKIMSTVRAMYENPIFEYIDYTTYKPYDEI